MRILFSSFAFLAVVLSFFAWADSGTPANISVPEQSSIKMADNTTFIADNAKIDNNNNNIDANDLNSGAGDPVVGVLISYKDKKIEESTFGFFAKKVDAVKDIENKVENADGEIGHVYENFNLVAAEIKESEIENLKNAKNIISVGKVSRLRIFLSDSVPLIEADKAWLEKINGINMTGAATSVCVLDTGIDSTHPDLSAKIIATHCYCNASDYGGGGCCPNNMDEDTDADDDHGHGTHVAGIVAASGGVFGVAKGASLIPIKIADNTGTAEDADLVKAIDWCISNSTKYNITVISLSMGDGFYTSYCDDEISLYPVKLAIDAAVAANISFVAATGNGGSSASIAAPACLFNATRVGSTTKSYTIAAYTNRGANFPDILLAPGSSITSTRNGGGYISMDGTSMATPHVSGALAILSEAYLQKNSILPSPSYLRSLLDSAGASIFDSGSGISYSRIDVLSALYTIGVPVQISGVFNNITDDSSSYFSVNESTALLFSIVLDQPVDYAWYRNSTSLENSAASWTWNIGKTDSGIWNITVVASNPGASDSASWTVGINDTFIPPDIFLSAPENHLSANNQTAIFSYIPYDTGALINCSLYMNVSGSWLPVKYNESPVISGDINNISYGISPDGAYIWNILCIDNDYMASFNSTNRTIYIDTTLPVPSILSPLSANYTALPSLNFTFNESNPDACFYSINSGENTTIGCFSNGTVPASIQGQNNLAFCMNDSASNINCTAVSFFYDSISPGISVSSPENITYDHSVIFINITTGEDASSCSYGIGSGNITMNGSVREFNASILVGDGQRQLSIYCTDMLGNIGFNDSIFFSVDTVPPIIDILSPIDKTYNKLWVMVNVTTDGSVACVASVSGDDNQTLENQSIIPSRNWTANISIGSDGAKNLTVHCNDTVGNLDYSSVSFSVSTSYVEIQLNSPADKSNLTGSSVAFNYTPDGIDIASCVLFANFSGVCSANESNSTPVIVGRENSLILSSVPDGIYSWTIGCFDSLGNISSADNNYTFTLDSVPPNMTIISPLNNSAASSSTKWVLVNITTSENAECRYNLSNTGFSFQSGGTQFSATGGLNHSFNYSGLNPGTSYTLYYKCMDPSSNVNSASVYHTFRISLSCSDSDGDGYGVGAGCLGTDCDDSDASRHGSCSSSSGSPRSSIQSSAPVVLVDENKTVDKNDDSLNKSEGIPGIVLEEKEINLTLNENKSSDDAKKSSGNIFAQILEIKDIVSRMENEKKISEVEKQEYLSRLREVMQLYEKEKYDEAQKIADEVRKSLSENASIKETGEKSESSLKTQIIYVITILAAISLLVFFASIIRRVRHLENHKNGGHRERND